MNPSLVNAIVVLCAVAALVFCSRRGLPTGWYWPVLTVWAAFMTAWRFMTHDYSDAAIDATWALICSWFWHRDRKRRDPAAKSYGYKARALVAKLATRQREAAEAPAG